MMQDDGVDRASSFEWENVWINKRKSVLEYKYPQIHQTVVRESKAEEVREGTGRSGAKAQGGWELVICP